MSKRPLVANLDFGSIKEDLITHFKSREEFKDYEFTGSGLNLLLDILAYNTHYNALTANFMMNEMFLDTAIMRNNVVSLAKSLNYTPRSAKSARSFITLNVPRVGTEQFYVVPAGTTFTAAVGNASLTFHTMDAHTVQFLSGDSEKTIQVTAYEGELATQRFIHTNNTVKFPSFDLINTSIDTTTIAVSVNGVKYRQVTPEIEGISNITERSNVFFIEETREQSHKVIFGDNTIGKALEIGDEIIISYLITNGRLGNGVSNFSVTIESRPDISVVSSDVSQGGDEPESIREIRANAPHWFQSQYRAVTENDYEVFLKKRYSDIQAISVYGGEKVGSPGKVFICIKPKSTDKLSDATKVSITNDILQNSNVVTITPVIVDPFFIDVIVKSVVVYDDNLLVSNPDILKASVFTMLNNFNTEYIGDFLKSFRVSQLSAEIQGIDDAVVSSNTRILLRTQVSALNSKLDRYGWSFENRLFHPNQGYKNDSGGIITSSLFTRQGRLYQSGFDDDGFGNLRLFDVIDGTKVYANNKAGIVNYATGRVDITTEFDPVDGIITFTVTPESFDVSAQSNSIIRIAVDSSQVNVVEKNNTSLLQNINLSRSA